MHVARETFGRQNGRVSDRSHNPGIPAADEYPQRSGEMQNAEQGIQKAEATEVVTVFFTFSFYIQDRHSAEPRNTRAEFQTPLRNMP